MRVVVSLLTFVCALAFAGQREYLVKLKMTPAEFTAANGGQLELVSSAGHLYKWTSATRRNLEDMRQPGIEFIQDNHKISLIENPSLAANREAIQAFVKQHPEMATRAAAAGDNPDIQAPKAETAGADPLLGNAWGIDLIGANMAWAKLPQGKEIVVAVTDTGVDYNHTDLISNIWRNPKEIAGDGLDNDGNGYVDDVVGWDFCSNDNKPFDLTMSLFEILLSGGNPGHGTHVAGVVGARLNNSLGTAGVAPMVKIMPLRFISEKGQGDTASAVKAIDYAVANGAKVINASWGSEGEEEGDEALREALMRAEEKGVIFVAAAGNGRVNQATGQPAGFSNDTDDKPMYPASYPYGNIIAVAAIDSALALANFSNYGAKTVDIAAPGVKILSTVPGNKFQDTVIDLGSLKVTWDGTSMASPFVAGSVAVLWSQNPAMSAKEVKEKLLAKAVKIGSVTGKVLTDGRVDLHPSVE